MDKKNILAFNLNVIRELATTYIEGIGINTPNFYEFYEAVSGCMVDEISGYFDEKGITFDITTTLIPLEAYDRAIDKLAEIATVGLLARALGFTAKDLGLTD